MTRFVLDSSLYIEAARDPTKASALAEFALGYLPRILLHAAVVQQMLAGAVSESARRVIYRDLVRPFERRRRLLTSRYGSWRRSGEIVAALIDRGELTAGGIPRSFMNDALIAASCREECTVLITRNRRDFARIRLVEPFQFEDPWPVV